MERMIALSWSRIIKNVSFDSRLITQNGRALIMQRFALASLVLLVVAASAALVPSFSAPVMVGESDVTHFWMPGVFGAVAVSGGPTPTVVTVIDIDGDGVPGKNCSVFKCPPMTYSSTGGDGGMSWAPAGRGQNTHGFTYNAVIPLGNGTFRGFDDVLLNHTTNTTAWLWYHEWQWRNGTVAEVGGGKATLTGLPQMDATEPAQLLPPSVRLSDGTQLAMFYGMRRGGVSFSSFLFASTDGGRNWVFRSALDRTPAMPVTKCPWWWRAPHSPHGLCEWGPSETGLTLLADGTTLLAVFRLHSGLNLWSATSTDGGVTWAAPTETPAWSVFPRLVTLANGAVVLASGRPSIGVWVADGGRLPLAWAFHNLAQAHNDNGGDPTSLPADWRYDAANAAANCSTSSVPMLTKAYTALVPLGCDAADTCSARVESDRLAYGNGGPPGPSG
jgi:hypothetical protein